MNSKRIHIFSNKPEVFRSSSYLLKYLAFGWIRNGHEISIGNSHSRPQVDIAILHVDMTEVSKNFLDTCSLYPLVLNGKFINNSKRNISNQIINRYSDYDGLVIIKTNANYGGLPELSTKYPAGIPKELIAISMDVVETKWSLVQHIPSEKYIVLNSIKNVNEDIWDNPYLIVEKFTPEIDSNGLYCMRACLFFGDKEVGIIVKSRSQIVKGHNVIDRQFISEIAPHEVQQFKYQHNMDFGRIDYVFNNGNVVILDANKTATISNTLFNQFPNLFINKLSQGLINYA